MMQYYFYFYSIVSGIALCVHLIINWRQLIGRHNPKSRAWVPEFRPFLICLSLFFVSDVLWGVLAELKCSRLLYADTIFYFLALALTVCAWTRYVVAYLDMAGRMRTCMLWAGHGLLAIFVAVMILNGFTNCCFYVNAQGEYVTAYLRHLMLILLVAFNAFSSWLTLAKMKHSEGVVRRHNKMVLAFGITMMVAIILQFMNPFLPLYALGCLFGCCILHVFVFEDERDEMHQKEILASEYKTKLEAEHAVNQAKSLFFSTVSHDIRTPLNAIIGFSELLERGAGGEEERVRYASSIHSSGKTLARLVDDILDLSKLESGKLEVITEPTDVPALVREVITACEVARARKSLVLKSELAEMPWVSVDPHRIRQILFNLLSNAYKYTTHGTITVRVEWRDGTLALSVADTGKGITKEDIDRIFQPFFQVADRNHRDGTGLGLSICQKLATLMDGEMSVESEVGKGSTFTITLHNVQVVNPPTAHSDSPGGPGIFRQFGRCPSRILVVDDSPINCEVLKSLLLKCGVADVAIAANGSEALTALKCDANFDMVLTDLWMPEMDGYALVCAIRADERLSRLPVYLLTADVEARSQAEARGFTGVIIKPITVESIKSLFA